MLTRKLILASHAPPLGDVKIGGLITNLTRPFTDVMMGDVEAVDLRKDCVISTEDTPFENGAGTVQNTFLTRIAQLLSSSYSGSDTTASKVAAVKSTLYELRDPQARFKALLSDARCREWIQEQHFEEGIAVYFVTAFYTATNQQVSESQKHTRSVTAGSTITQGDANIVPACVDVKVHGEHIRSSGEEHASSSSGERVFEFSAQKVIVSSIDKAKFKLDRVDMWKVIAGVRSAQDEDAADYVEVTLEEADADPDSSAYTVDSARTVEHCLKNTEL